MNVLAEVFRKARSLWPLAAADADKTVVVRIDVLKDLEAEAIVHAQGCYVLAKNSARDGQVRAVTPEEVGKLDPKMNAVLSFGRGCGFPGEDMVKSVSIPVQSQQPTPSKRPWYHLMSRFAKRH